MKRLAVIFMLGAALAAPALAQGDDERAAALARGKAVLEKLKAADPALFGTQWFGIYLNGTTNIGKMKLTTAAAPEGSGAAYLVAMEMSLTFGPQKHSGTFEALFDAGFALVSRSSVEVTEVPEGRIEKKETFRQVDGEWVFEADIDGHKTTVKLATGEPNHWEMSSLMPLVGKLDASKPQTLIFRGIHWPKPEESDDPPPAVKDIVVTVLEPAKISYRGPEVEARMVRVEKTDDDTTDFALDATGRVLAAKPLGPPIVIVAGTEEECGKDLPAAGAATPKEAVIVYMRVLAKDLPVSALDGVMDFAALLAGMGAENEAIAKQDIATFAANLKSSFAEQDAPFTKDDVAQIEPQLTTTEDGDEAKVTLPDMEDDPFLVHRIGGVWKITRFPH